MKKSCENCAHRKVCEHNSTLIEAFRPVLEQLYDNCFDTTTPDHWVDFYKVIGDNCKFYNKG